jgi:hypothetical protein
MWDWKVEARLCRWTLDPGPQGALVSRLWTPWREKPARSTLSGDVGAGVGLCQGPNRGTHQRPSGDGATARR